MDIDLLLSDTHEGGLICTQNLPKKAIGIVFDGLTGLFHLEYADMDILELNIPVDHGFHESLTYNKTLHLGAVKNGQIAQAYQIPLMLQDDPYRLEKLGKITPSPMPLEMFNHFIKRCIIGQPVHRNDLGDDASSGCVLQDASPAALQFAPHLAREHALEVRPTAAPSAPGFNAPGLGGSTSTSRGGAYRSGGSGHSGDNSQ